MNENEACVLVYGLDNLLLGTRAKVIRTAGFCTCEVACDADLVRELLTGRCKAVVICHTVADSDAERVTLLAKQWVQCVKVIVMSPTGSHFTVSDADETLRGFVGPVELLAAIHRVLQ